MKAPRPLSVVIVDDSPYARYVLERHLAAEGFLVLGDFGRAEEAIWAIPTLAPDLVTMDVLMPGLNGIEAVRALRTRWSGSILMVSSRTRQGAAATWAALEAGADDFVAKPEAGCSLADVIAVVAAKGRSLVAARSAHRDPARVGANAELAALPGERELQLLVMGASTGGPRAVSGILAGLNGPPRIPIVIIQHMPVGFTRFFADRLAEVAGCAVRESPLDGAAIAFHPPPIVLAASGQHLHVSRSACWSTPGERRHGVIPALDVTLQDAAAAFDARLGAMVLTGMGNDGRQGAIAVRRAGGVVIAESRDTAVIWGMPRAVVEAGAASRVWPLPMIRHWLRRVVR